ncbi:hypothetical protein F751_5036 [Auxenochlorella protothecoides]|uniref:Uncharacterized protein n=1 Tax=Auxenochlorella protothecoides TaxID=3075 RepID=A0A087SEP0_AUXPR|nr:hypothetical protein F751_5036 [Auxenochlorella protothecoides]KFM24194.1 hypothetical protein F751_5036 [Auxenochlorella protothecoides]
MKLAYVLLAMLAISAVANARTLQSDDEEWKESLHNATQTAITDAQAKWAVAVSGARKHMQDTKAAIDVAISGARNHFEEAKKKLDAEKTFDKIEKELEDFFHKESPEVAPAVAPVVSPVAPPVNVSGSRAVPVSGARVAPTPLPAPVPAPLPSPDTHKWELPSKDDLIAALSG